MSEQHITIIRAHECKPLDLQALRYWLHITRTDSEWIVKNADDWGAIQREAIKKLEAELAECKAECERLVKSRATIAEEQIILRKDLDEAQRHWDKTHRQLKPLETELAECKAGVMNLCIQWREKKGCVGDGDCEYDGNASPACRCEIAKIQQIVAPK